MRQCPTTYLSLVGVRGGWAHRLDENLYIAMLNKEKTKENITNKPRTLESYFYSLKSKDANSNLDSQCMIKMYNEITKIVGIPKKFQNENNGTLLLEIANSLQRENLKKLHSIQGIKIDIIEHQSFNQSKGVIYAPQLINSAEETILEEMKSQDVIAVRRFTRFSEGKVIPTPSLLLTFHGTKLPEKAKIIYLSFNIQQYIPQPRRCNFCQKLGHFKKFCRSMLNEKPETCAKCGGRGHSAGGCQKEPYCINCEGQHPAYHKSCPNFIMEREVLALHIQEKISIREARYKLQPTPKRNLSYAAAAKPENTNPNPKNLNQRKPTNNEKDQTILKAKNIQLKVVSVEEAFSMRTTNESPNEQINNSPERAIPSHNLKRKASPMSLKEQKKPSQDPQSSCQDVDGCQAISSPALDSPESCQQNQPEPKPQRQNKPTTHKPEKKLIQSKNNTDKIPPDKGENNEQNQKEKSLTSLQSKTRSYSLSTKYQTHERK